MHIARVGSVLLTLGLLVGGAAGIGLMFGFDPASLPAAMLNVAAYKITFVAAGGLLVAGAMLLRYARQRARNVAPQDTTANTPLELGEALPERDAFTPPRDREHFRSRLDR